VHCSRKEERRVDLRVEEVSVGRVEVADLDRVEGYEM
jgi:hypothetical protein